MKRIFGEKVIANANGLMVREMKVSNLRSAWRTNIKDGSLVKIRSKIISEK